MPSNKRMIIYILINPCYGVVCAVKKITLLLNQINLCILTQKMPNVRSS